jgi:hypothetical protein
MSDLVLGHQRMEGSEIMRIFIDAATGALGRRLVPLIGANGHEIVGTAAATAADNQPREQAPARQRPRARIARGAYSPRCLQHRPDGLALPDAIVVISLPSRRRRGREPDAHHQCRLGARHTNAPATEAVGA